MNAVRVGVGVVVIRDNMVLLGKRMGSHGAGTWSCPGGHVEYGETIAECSIRETLEETGMQAEMVDDHYLGWNEKVWHEDNKHYITIYTLATVSDEAEPEIKEPHKCEEWRWFTKKELQGLTLMETKRMKGVIEEALEHFNLLCLHEATL